MSFLGGSPKGGLKISGNLSQIAYQCNKTAVGVDTGCRMNDNMPKYFMQASFDACMGWLGPDSNSIICGEMRTAYVIAPGVCTNCA